MPIKTCKKYLRKATLIISCFIFSITSNILAAEKIGQEIEEEESLTILQEQARDYRDEGFKLQEIGDLEGALKLYQKASQIDPKFYVVYNDLGILFEARGQPDEAESNYLKALKINPYYLSTYSNLALLYESKRDLEKAAYCWKKRVELGDANDPWTIKAKQRLGDVGIASSERPLADAREREVVSLMKDVASEKDALGNDDKALARKKLKDAKRSYAKEDYATAIRNALDAQYLDQDNKEIETFIEKTQNRALTR